MSQTRFGASIRRAAKALLAVAISLTAFTVASANDADAAAHKKRSQYSKAASADGWSRKSYLGASVQRGGEVSESVASGKKARRYAKSSTSRNVRVASLGNEVYTPKRARSRSVATSGSGNIVWSASASCLNGTLRNALAEVSHVASIRVNSTCRSRSHNARVGGAKHSHHLTGDAVDFRVLSGNSRAVYAALHNNGSLGGIKHYGGGLYHIDTGPRRSW
jgi:hypothetical protein